MISQTAEYALRAAVCLAGAEEARTTQSISESTGVSASYMSKILRRLRRRGIVNAQRGPHGGFLLTRSPAEITALDVIEAVDPPPDLNRCPLHLSAHRHNLCPLHAKLAHTFALMQEAFRESTLRDLVVSHAGDGGGCAFPSNPAAEQDGDGKPGR